jgi:hypothetical protein
MIRWLHRYIFKGLGILMLIGMITALILALNSGTQRAAETRTAAPIAAH